MQIHDLLDEHYGQDGDERLRQMLQGGAPINSRFGALEETPLHVAARRRRLGACGILLDHGADVDARNACGKTAYAHSIRRGFHEIAELLVARGADATLNAADRLAVALTSGLVDDARAMLDADGSLARTGNMEEDRILADLAGRDATEPVALLIEYRANLAAPGLDGGTPLHQSAWFGQPANARMLIDAGAPLDVFDPVHEASPIHWAAHGSRHSGDAESRQHAYVEIAQLLLGAGCSLCYPEDPGSDRYIQRILSDASEPFAAILRDHLA